MITVLEAINLSAQFLAQRGIESPRINAELLLANIIGCKRLDLYLTFDKPLNENELCKYREYIKRRGLFEPLQYITGKVEFYGLEFLVNRSVLIPRSETELLVENILKYFQNAEKLHIIDIGCGCGNIAISLAANLPEAQFIATDISEETLSIARENSLRHNFSHRIKFIKHNILEDSIDDFPMFDVVVSNPPYVSKDNFLSLQREIKDFEPGIAVTDNADGYTFFRAIAERLSVKLKKNGKIFFEIAQGQSDEVRNILIRNNFCNINIIKDYQDIYRIISGEIK